jgi:3-deoxy-D-manno-octulosonic-acid transferase
MYFLYSIALSVALALSTPWWLWAMLRHGKYRNGLRERFGGVPQRVMRIPKPQATENAPGCVWVHAVSVGEVLAVTELVRELQLQWPQARIVVSTTTDTGQMLARHRFGEENVFYFPLDFAFAIRPYLLALQPELIVIAETEFWPNFLRLAHASGARVAVVNARISDRSYPRYLRFRGLLRGVLTAVNLFLAQSHEDGRRLIAIGAVTERVRVAGNLKFDVAPPDNAPFAAELKRRLEAAGAFPVLVCGSTVEEEELPLLASFQVLLEKYPTAMMVLAPRRPERFDEVERLLKAFTRIRCWRRSRLPDDAVLAGGVLLLDTVGELASVYSVATLALVGGSLAPRGGHNILEPAFFDVPILVGPHTENFRDIISVFRAQDAVRVVRAFREDGVKGDLTDAIMALIEDGKERERLGRRAGETVRSHAGATARTARELEILL